MVTSMGRNPATGTDEAFDFKGNLLRSTRQLVEDYKNDARLVADAGSAGSRDLHQQHTLRRPQPAHPALRAAQHRRASLNVIQPAYNEANLLERVDVGWSCRRAGRSA